MSGLAVVATVVFVALTVVVVLSSPLGVDSRAFQIANEIRAPWLDTAARTVTTLGLFAVVGPVLLAGAVLLLRYQHRGIAVALLLGAGLTWISVWITKAAVVRARPPAPLVHTAGYSYPSGHAANSVGWLALAIALTVAIPSRIGRLAIVAAGALIATFVGLSRIYLRAHYASDVLAGESLATAMYALAALGTLTGPPFHDSGRSGAARPPARR